MSGLHKKIVRRVDLPAPCSTISRAWILLVIRPGSPAPDLTEKEKQIMTKIKPVPEGMHTVTPHLVCAGAADAIEFYKNAFNQAAQKFCS